MSYPMDNRPAKGTALYTRKLIERLLDDDRFEFTLVHYDQVDDPLYGRAKELRLPVTKLLYASHLFAQLRFFWRYRKNDFDIIHWFLPRLYPFYWLAPAKRIVVTAHAAGDKTAPAFFNFPKLVFNFVMTWCNRPIDAAIAVSEFAKTEVVRHYRFNPERVFVTYNAAGEEFRPIDKPAALRQVAAKYHLPDSFILDISRLQRHKNVETLITAYEILRNNHPERREVLVIVGSPVRGYRAPIELAKRSAYREDIHFIDYVDGADLNALYAAAKLFVFPSFNEGFGIPIVEAFASGTPVITSNFTALPEIAGGAATLVDPRAPAAIAKAMNQILSDGKLYQTMRTRGLARAKAFTWQRTADQTKEIYLQLLSRRL